MVLVEREDPVVKVESRSVVMVDESEDPTQRGAPQLVGVVVFGIEDPLLVASEENGPPLVGVDVAGREESKDPSSLTDERGDITSRGDTVSDEVLCSRRVGRLRFGRGWFAGKVAVDQDWVWSLDKLESAVL